MPIYKKWTIIKVPFPFTDKTSSKVRPALVLSNQDFHEEHNHVIACMITSVKNSSWASDIAVTDLELSGIPSPSVIRFKVFTLHDGLILGVLGSLSKQDQSSVQKKLKQTGLS